MIDRDLKSARFAFMMSEDLRDKFFDTCMQKDTTPSVIARKLITDYVRKNDNAASPRTRVTRTQTARPRH